MKLHRISLTNLNSLYGQHTVDLDRDLGGASLFLVMGPTGSGKSTLMDAVSLALFGRTPRLRSPAKRGDDQATIVSRGAGHAQAQVDFSKLGPGGRTRYRATWRVWRARHKPTGELQTPRRSLEQWKDDDWVPLHDDDEVRRKYMPAFNEVLEGFTVDLFQRSMLLAQGEFDAFLSARPDDRAEVLERLTETSSYKRIGEKASRFRKAWQNEIKKLENQLEGDGPLDPEVRRHHLQRRDTLQHLMDQLHHAIGFLRERAEWTRAEAADARELEEARRAESEATAARAAIAGDLERLEQHERATGVFEAIDDLDRIGERRVQLEQDLVTLRARLPELQAHATTTAAEARATQRALDTTQRHHEALREAVEGWSQAKEREETARRERSAASSHAASARERLASTTGTAAAKKQALTEAEQQLAEAMQHAPEHAVDEAVAAVIGSLETEAQLLMSQHQALESSRIAIAGRSHMIASEQADLRRRHDAFASRRERTLGPIEERARSHRARLETLLAGELIPDKRQREMEGERSAAESKVQALVDASAAITRWATAVQRRSEASSAAEAARTEARHARQAMSQAESAMTAAESAVRSIRDQHDRSRRIASLIEHREVLTDGDPCPLCGSEHHPLTGDPAVATKDARIREELAASADALRTAEQSLSDLQSSLARAEATLSLRDKAHEEARVLREDRAAEEKRARTAAVDASRRPRFTLGRDPEAALVNVAAELRTAREKVDLITLDLQRLTDAVNARNTVEASLQEARRGFDHEQQEMERADSAITERADALAKDQERLTHQESEHEAFQEDFAERLEELGLQPDRAAPPVTWMETAHARAAAHTRRQTERQHATALASATRAAFDQAEALREAAEQASQEATGSERVRVEAHESASLELSEATAAVHTLWRTFDDRDTTAEPPALLAQLEATLRQHRTAFEEADARSDAAQTPVVETRTRIDAHSEDLQQCLVQLEAAQQRLSAALDEHALTLENARAARLPAAEVRALRERRDHANTRLSNAVAVVADRDRRHKDRLQQRPEHLGEISIDLLDAAGDALQAAYEERQEQFDAVRDAISLDDALRARSRDTQDRLALLRGKARIWLRLHDLIGTGDGDAFKTFAQSLNLGRLLSQANHHLARLSERYRLIIETDAVGMPTLEFLVEDAWQQGTLRSPRTLSGGERFLVSLALALGLSDLRNVSMPIETLLLDEGFGTLDAETLDVALAALQQLRSSGRQVGIISHVVGLHERVEARILIEPQGGGRSVVRAELG